MNVRAIRLSMGTGSSFGDTIAIRKVARNQLTIDGEPVVTIRRYDHGIVALSTAQDTVYISDLNYWHLEKGSPAD